MMSNTDYFSEDSEYITVELSQFDIILIDGDRKYYISSENIPKDTYRNICYDILKNEFKEIDIPGLDIFDFYYEFKVHKDKLNRIINEYKIEMDYFAKDSDYITAEISQWNILFIDTNKEYYISSENIPKDTYNDLCYEILKNEDYNIRCSDIDLFYFYYELNVHKDKLNKIINKYKIEMEEWIY